MTRLTMVVAMLIMVAGVARAQDASVVASAKQELLSKGVNLSGPCGALKLTNLVAWRLNPRFGLLHKAGGNRAILKPDGSCLTGEQTSDSEGYATDYIIETQTGFGFDLLGDGGGANVPQWLGPENAPDMVARNWANYRVAVNPSAYVETTPIVVPPPTTTVPPIVIVVPPTPIVPLPTVDFGAILKEIETKLDTHVTSVETFQAAVTSEWKKFGMFTAKYILPIVGGLFAGHYLTATP